MDTDDQLAAAIRAAASADWTQRANGGEELAQWADHNDLIAILRGLLLDQGDTMVTERTCRALLRRNDIHGIRLIAEAVERARAPDLETEPHLSDHIDHLHDAMTGEWWPDGPTQAYLDACNTLSTDPDPTISSGARHLLEWAQPWHADPGHQSQLP